MLILDKGIKDYYDWYCSVLGIDTSVVYDRRTCTPIKNDCASYTLQQLFSTVPISSDKPRTIIKNYWKSTSVIYRNNIMSKRKDTNTFKEWLKCGKDAKLREEGVFYYFILEVGDTHYYFEVERYLDKADNTICHLEPALVKKREHITKRYGGTCPVSIIPLNPKRLYSYLSTDIWRASQPDIDARYDNPIMISTYIPSFVSAEEMWRGIYDYLSSLKDKKIEDNRTNDEHIENAGFDKKSSFRPKIKK